MRPTLAFVVPVFKQGTLLAEAVRSIVAARAVAGSEAPIVVVNDGCPFESTHATCLSLSRSVGRLYYVATQNKGLSAARNRGIDFVLDKLPEVEAIYFLDADNLVETYSIGSMADALAAHEEDWFYPNINMFGIAWPGDYTGPYDPLVEALANVCEAGSLVRTRVFRSGLRFDEAMRLGYEDWDFWLSATEKGFRGRHLPELGFKYRKRPESMLAGSNRDVHEIMRYLYKKHEWTFNPKTLLQLESVENPRYAIYVHDRPAVLMMSGSTVVERLTLEQYRARIVGSIVDPSRYNVGAYFGLCSQQVLSVLTECRLLAWVSYDLEARTLGNAISTLRLERRAGQRLRVRTPVSASDGRAHLCLMRVELLRDIVAGLDDPSDWPLLTDAPFPRLSSCTLELPAEMAEIAPGTAMHRLSALCSDFHAQGFPTVRSWPVPFPSAGIPARFLQSSLIGARIGASHTTATSLSAAIDIAFVFSTFESGEIERVAAAVSRVLRKNGFRSHAIVFGSHHAKWDRALCEIFESVRFVSTAMPRSSFRQNYEGMELPPLLLEDQQSHYSGLFADLDIVVSCHAAGLWGIAAQLRKWGILVVSYNHVDDTTDLGRPDGHPQRAVAYEHTVDLFVACSLQMSRKLLGRGVPGEKIVSVPSSSGIDEGIVRSRDWVAHRMHRADRAPATLRVLFVGPLDARRGVDRLGALVRIARDTRLDVAFRIVGQDGGAGGPKTEVAGVAVEPAARDDEGRLDLMAWADVLVLPSRGEGLPLAVVDAAMCGVVAIAADAGAVREVLHDDVNGCVVSQAGCVPETIRHLARLSAEPDTRLRMALAALRMTGERSWESAVAPLAHRLTGEVRSRRRRLDRQKAHLFADAEPDGGGASVGPGARPPPSDAVGQARHRSP